MLSGIRGRCVHRWWIDPVEHAQADDHGEHQAQPGQGEGELCVERVKAALEVRAEQCDLGPDRLEARLDLATSGYVFTEFPAERTRDAVGLLPIHAGTAQRVR